MYVPAPYVGLFLCFELTPVEAWNRLSAAIDDATAESACRTLIYWLRAAIVRSGPNTYSELVVPGPLAPLLDTLLLRHRHRHRLLLSHLPGIDPSINQAAGTRIAETVG